MPPEAGDHRCDKEGAIADLKARIRHIEQEHSVYLQDIRTIKDTQSQEAIAQALAERNIKYYESTIESFKTFVSALDSKANKKEVDHRLDAMDERIKNIAILVDVLNTNYKSAKIILMSVIKTLTVVIAVSATVYQLLKWFIAYIKSGVIFQ